MNAYCTTALADLKRAEANVNELYTVLRTVGDESLALLTHAARINIQRAIVSIESQEGGETE